MRNDKLVEQIDNLLPQTQCEQCGYPGCRPYAEAIANGESHNLCPPGGDAAQQQLANLLGRESLPLNVPDNSQPGKRLEAVIREEECIGCKKCIQACPVDAIVGASQFMHTVISHECTGCELCVEPCPVDCIDMVLRPTDQQELTDTTRFHARDRYLARNQRLENAAAQHKEDRIRKRQQRTAMKPISNIPETPLNQIKADYQRAKTQHKQIMAAIAHMKRNGLAPPQPEHITQANELEQKVEQLKKAVKAGLETAKQQLADQGQDLGKLKLAATRSELAWRHAKAQGIKGEELMRLQAQRDNDQNTLTEVMRQAGLSDPD